MPRRKNRKLRIVVNGKELESVTQFCYLRSMVTEDCRSECEVRRHIAFAKEAFNKKKDLMCGSPSLQLKKTHSQSIRMEYSIVWKWNIDPAKEWHKKDWSIWNVDLALHVKDILDRLSTKKNDEVLKAVQTWRELTDTLRTGQKRWLGHVLRHGSLVRTVLEGWLPGKKGTGRPKEMLLSWLLKTNNKYMDCFLCGHLLVLEASGPRHRPNDRRPLATVTCHFLTSSA